MIPYVCILKQKNKLNSFKYIPSSLLCWPPPRGTLRNLKFLSWAWAGNWEEIQGSPFLTWWRGSSSPPNLLGSPVKAYPCLLRLVWKLNESTCHQANINCKELLGINLLKSQFTHLKKKMGSAINYTCIHRVLLRIKGKNYLRLKWEKQLSTSRAYAAQRFKRHSTWAGGKILEVTPIFVQKVE